MTTVVSLLAIFKKTVVPTIDAFKFLNRKSWRSSASEYDQNFQVWRCFIIAESVAESDAATLLTSNRNSFSSRPQMPNPNTIFRQECNFGLNSGRQFLPPLPSFPPSPSLPFFHFLPFYHSLLSFPLPLLILSTILLVLSFPLPPFIMGSAYYAGKCFENA